MANSFVADAAHRRKVVGQHIADTFAGSRTLSLAVAYIGDNAIDLLQLSRNCRVTIICDLRSSGCNPFAVRALARRANITVRALDGLHAKVYLSESAAVVTSANLSGHALTSGSLEAGVHITDASTLVVVRAWYASLLAASEDARPILAREFDTLAARWRQRAAPHVAQQAKPSLLDALLTDHPSLADYVFTFYIDEWDYSEAEVKKAAKQHGVELPPSKVWHRYEDPFDLRIARFLDNEMGVKGRRSIGLEVREWMKQFVAVESLDSDASVFVNHFRMGELLVTNLLRESRPAFSLTGKDAATLCRRLTEGLARRPSVARKLWKRPGWFFEASELRALLD